MLDQQYEEVKNKTEKQKEDLSKYEDEAQEDIKLIHEAYEENKEAVQLMLLD